MDLLGRSSGSYICPKLSILNRKKYLNVLSRFPFSFKHLSHFMKCATYHGWMEWKHQKWR